MDPSYFPVLTLAPPTCSLHCGQCDRPNCKSIRETIFFNIPQWLLFASRIISNLVEGTYMALCHVVPQAPPTPLLLGGYGVEHLFLHLLTICLSSSVKYLFKSFTHFKNKLFIFLSLTEIRSLYILNTLNI